MAERFAIKGHRSNIRIKINFIKQIIEIIKWKRCNVNVVEIEFIEQEIIKLLCDKEWCNRRNTTKGWNDIEIGVDCETFQGESSDRSWEWTIIEKDCKLISGEWACRG